MAMKSPQIQLFNAVFSRALALNVDVYDYLPGKDQVAPYPFIHVDESNDDDVINNKDVITGRISQTIHVWGLANNRALFADISFKLKQELRQLTQLDNYYLRLLSLNSNNIYDNTTTDNLIHGIIQAEYQLS